MSNRAAVSESGAPRRTESVALHTRARTQARQGHAQEAPPAGAGPTTGAMPTADPNTTNAANPARSVFIERDDRMERLENSLFLLAGEFARDREERAMRRHARERSRQGRDVYSGSHDEGGQDDVPDPSIRDIEHNPQEERTAHEQVPRRLETRRDEGRRDLRAQPRAPLPQASRSAAGAGTES